MRLVCTQHLFYTNRREVVRKFVKCIRFEIGIQYGVSIGRKLGAIKKFSIVTQSCFVFTVSIVECVHRINDIIINNSSGVEIEHAECM